MATIFHVAKYFLDKLGPMSVWKLQKLCYYAQAWSLVWDEKPLFQEDFQAWSNGPVCPELYQIHKGIHIISSEQFMERLKEAARKECRLDPQCPLNEDSNFECPYDSLCEQEMIAKNE